MLSQMTLTQVVSAVLCLMSAMPLSLQATEILGDSVKAAQAEPLIFRVTLNTEAKGDMFIWRTPDFDFFVKIEDLKLMGFKEPAGRVVVLEGESHLSLKSMRGVSFSFEEKTFF